jgi:hypothetical protein
MAIRFRCLIGFALSDSLPFGEFKSSGIRSEGLSSTSQMDGLGRCSIEPAKGQRSLLRRPMQRSPRNTIASGVGIWTFGSCFGSRAHVTPRRPSSDIRKVGFAVGVDVNSQGKLNRIPFLWALQNGHQRLGTWVLGVSKMAERYFSKKTSRCCVRVSRWKRAGGPPGLRC